LEDIDTDGRRVPKRILDRSDRMDWTDIEQDWGLAEGSCEYGNEPYLP
jgi:hypothetical protein